MVRASVVEHALAIEGRERVRDHEASGGSRSNAVILVANLID
jgi:hypothetical protein